MWRAMGLLQSGDQRCFDAFTLFSPLSWSAGPRHFDGISSCTQLFLAVRPNFWSSAVPNRSYRACRNSQAQSSPAGSNSSFIPPRFFCVPSIGASVCQHRDQNGWYFLCSSRCFGRSASTSNCIVSCNQNNWFVPYFSGCFGRSAGSFVYIVFCCRSRGFCCSRRIYPWLWSILASFGRSSPRIFVIGWSGFVVSSLWSAWIRQCFASWSVFIGHCGSVCVEFGSLFSSGGHGETSA